MIYRTTEQFFPSSYIKKRRKFQKDQRVIRDRIWRFYAHYSYPKRIVSETRPTATSLDNINPTPPPFSRRISQRHSEKARNRNWQNVVSNAITWVLRFRGWSRYSPRIHEKCSSCAVTRSRRFRSPASFISAGRTKGGCSPDRRVIDRRQRLDD